MRKASRRLRAPADMPIATQPSCSERGPLPNERISQLSDRTHAAAVRVALTTDVAAETYDLEFISRTRPIEMLWTAFCLTCSDAEASVGSTPTTKEGE